MTQELFGTGNTVPTSRSHRGNKQSQGISIYEPAVLQVHTGSFGRLTEGWSVRAKYLMAQRVPPRKEQKKQTQGEVEL